MLIRCLLPMLLCQLPAQDHKPNYDETGPLSLLITYRCEAAKRPAFRSYLKKQGLEQFERWKKAGVLEHYRVFFNWYVDETTWDAMAMIKFH